MAYVYGTADDDVIHGDDNSGSLGNDTLWGFGGNDRLYGHDGQSDYLIGGEGADIIDGGAGADMTDYRTSSAGVVIDLETGRGYGGEAESDRLYSIEHVIGSNHNDTLMGRESHSDFFDGSDGGDTLKGYGGDDNLYGGNGDDTLKGGGGADVLHGGAGLDAVAYQDSPTRVFVSLLNNTASYGDAEGDTFTFIENVTGSAHNDDLWGHNGANALNGMDGNDKLKGFGGADTLLGEAGDDVLDGGTGADSMRGSAGNDRFFVDTTGDVVNEASEQGSDTVIAAASYTLSLGSSVELLRTAGSTSTGAINLNGNELVQTLQGNAAGNTLDGRGGADTMQGFAGADSYFVDNAGDAVMETGNNGSDRIVVTATMIYTLATGVTVELLRTSGSSSTFNVNLHGNNLINAIQGNNGTNVLSGGLGNDTMTGFGGTDVFRFNTALGATNVDTVTDFNVPNDLIQIDDAVFAGMSAGALAAGAFRIGAAAADADDRIIYNSATGALIFDSNGNAANGAIQFATLATGLALTNNDFAVI